MKSPISRLAWLALLALTPGFLLLAEPYADQVVVFNPGPDADFGTEDNMLGPPQGTGSVGGSADVCSLGVGGETVLHLDTRAWNGPGTDLLVSENPFIVSGSTWTAFAETLFVEVSSDGTHFARFPTRYHGQNGPYLQGSLMLGADMTDFDGFAGVMPVHALPPSVDPLHVVSAGGDAFDFADLMDHPLVVGGQVDLDQIEFVRLIDVEAGVAQDGEGTVVWDCGFPAFASADVDAVCAVNSIFNNLPGRPRVELDLDPGTGLLTLRLEDDDGLQDIKLGLSASANGISFPFEWLMPFMIITQIDSQGATLLTGPIPANFERMILKVSARDGAGLTGGDALFVP